MKRLLFIFVSLMLLGAGCGGDYVTGVPSNRAAKGDFIIPGTVGVSAIVAPALNRPAGRSENSSFILPEK